MAHQLDPPRITATAITLNTHHVNIIDPAGQPMKTFPMGASVLEVWAAHVPAGVPVERAYASFSWMKPSASLPVVVTVSSVTGRDPLRGGPGRWHLFYKARWVRDGGAVSAWSNVVVAGDEQGAPEQRASSSGGPAPI
ncbi:MAG TPA: hypothetical protein VEB22_10985 [Phycisphaerales bacterium]|nr:hypothetical protein [Phycisphaerales bacterium]